MTRTSRGPWYRQAARRVVSALLPAAVVLVGCHRPPPTGIAVDFAAEIDRATVNLEVAAIDIGTPEARGHFGAGWFHDERNRTTGETFVWSNGNESELFFHLGWRRPVELEISGRPFDYPGASPQTMAFELDGHLVAGPVQIDRDRSTFVLTLPAEDQNVGRNRLLARYGRSDAPADVVAGSSDERLLAFAWSGVRFVGSSGAGVVAEPDGLTVPPGCRIDFFTELSPNSELLVGACESVGGESGRLTVEIMSESESQPERFDIACAGGPARIRLDDRRGLTRIRLATGPIGLSIKGGRVVEPGGAPAADEAAVPAMTVQPDTTSRPNVIIYLVDALRSDRLGVYGCDRGLSPRLDGMAADGVVFTDMTAQSSWTKAAVASIFTGIWPRAHGVNGPDDRLPAHLPTIAERLHEAGYRTGAVVANAYVGRPFGFARGFDHFEYLEYGKGRSEIVGDRVENWLTNLTDDNAPFFLYVHTIDPHAPYAPPEEFRSRFAPRVSDPTVGRVEIVRGLVLGSVEPTAELGRDLRDLYDAEVAANDASFGRLLDFLEMRDQLANTLIVFTSDHGEAFGEHGSWTHGIDLYNEVLSVPLVLRLPQAAAAGLRVSDPVQHIDLMPTILDRCGVDGAGELPGVRLLSGDGIARMGEDRTVFAYLDYWGQHGATAIRSGWKLIEPLSAEFGEARELYRRDVDPAETNDLAAEHPVRNGWLTAQLGAALRVRGRAVTTNVDPDIREQLEALGYLQ